jgi:hypothetical protein
MRSWIAATLVAILALQFSGSACRPQAHDGEISSATAAHHHDSQSPSNSEPPVQVPDCTLMLMCSAAPPLAAAKLTMTTPVYAARYATTPPRMHRDPILVTPTPPPRFG